jgi:hypothetical protein
LLPRVLVRREPLPWSECVYGHFERLKYPISVEYVELPNLYRPPSRSIPVDHVMLGVHGGYPVSEASTRPPWNPRMLPARGTKCRQRSCVLLCLSSRTGLNATDQCAPLSMPQCLGDVLCSRIRARADTGHAWVRRRVGQPRTITVADIAHGRAGVTCLRFG